jgi:transposase
MKKESKVNVKYSIGIDMSQKEFHVCASVIDTEQRIVIKGSRKFDNSPSGFAGFVKWVEGHCKEDLPVKYLMEATGVYHENLCHYLYEAGLFVTVLPPNLSKSYAKSLGTDSKTDKIDAKLLSRMAAERSLTQWQPFSPLIMQLRGQTRQHESLQCAKTQFTNQLHALESSHNPNQEMVTNLRDVIDVLSEKIDQLHKSIKKTIKDDKKLNKKWENIKEIPGIAELSFATIVAETNGFTLFYNERQLVSYAGYNVIENQSGKHKGKTKISKKGNTHIRRILFMPAFNAVKSEDSVFANLYHRIFEKTKIKMKGYTAVQRKLLTTIFHIWKKDEKFDLNYQPETSSKEEQKPLFPLHNGNESQDEKQKTATIKTVTVLDELPCKSVAESPLSVMQR